MINKFLNDSVFLPSFRRLHIILRDLFDELINSRLGHQLNLLLSSIVIVEPSFFDFLLLLFLHGLFDILLVSRRQIDLMLKIIVLFLQEPSICLLDRVELVEDE